MIFMNYQKKNLYSFDYKKIQEVLDLFIFKISKANYVEGPVLIDDEN